MNYDLVLKEMFELLLELPETAFSPVGDGSFSITVQNCFINFRGPDSAGSTIVMVGGSSSSIHFCNCGAPHCDDLPYSEECEILLIRLVSKLAKHHAETIERLRLQSEEEENQKQTDQPIPHDFITNVVGQIRAVYRLS